MKNGPVSSPWTDRHAHSDLLLPAGCVPRQTWQKPGGNVIPVVLCRFWSTGQIWHEPGSRVIPVVLCLLWSAAELPNTLWLQITSVFAATSPLATCSASLAVVLPPSKARLSSTQTLTTGLGAPAGQLRPHSAHAADCWKTCWMLGCPLHGSLSCHLGLLARA